MPTPTLATFTDGNVISWGQYTDTPNTETNSNPSMAGINQ